MDATALLESTGALLPHMTVLVTGLVILTLDLFLTPQSRYLNEVVGLIGLLVAFFFTLSTAGAPRQVFMGMAVVDYLGAFFNATFLLIAALTILLSASYVRREGVSAGEYYALVLFATTGFMFVAAAADLIMVFLAIETLSIATYILAGLLREDPRSQEAAFKYFMLGALSSAFFLYGIATIYGALGNTNLLHLAQALGQGDFSPLLLMGMALLIVGLGFKVAVVPFHMWVPDVYDGAPAPVTGFMAAGVKAAAFATLVRILVTGYGDTAAGAHGWRGVIVLLAYLTMFAGNLLAVPQRSVKRMLAYSSIAHAGYLLVAVAAMGTTAPRADATEALLFYLAAYGATVIGAFAVVALIERKLALSGLGDDLSSWAGLSERHPALAAAMSLFMVSLAGIPPTAGFMAKLTVFRSAIEADLVPLAVFGVITSVAGLYYYLRVVVYVYMVPEAKPGAIEGGRLLSAGLAIAGCALIVLWMGVQPGTFASIAQTAATAFVR